MSSWQDVDVWLDFSSWESPPTVNQSRTRECTEVPSTKTGVIFRLGLNTFPPNMPPNYDDLQITDVKFFSDPNKTTEVHPAFFTSGPYFGHMNRVILFKSGVAVPAKTTLYFTLYYINKYVIDHGSKPFDWDPRLDIDPR